MLSEMKRGFALGAKHGIKEGYKRYMQGETAVVDETAMQGAIGIIVAVGGVLIALYIIAVVVGSISYSVTGGNIKLSPTWCQTVLNIDSQAQASFNLANVLPIAIIGVGTVLCLRIKSLVYIATYSYDRYRCLQRPGDLNKPDHQPDPANRFGVCRTLNIAYA